MMAFPEIPFATISDLEARWRAVSPSELIMVDALLEDASQLIVDQVPQAAGASASTLRRVVCSVVKRAMQAPPVVGAESIQQGAGAYQATVNFSNPSGDLYLSKSEKQSLGWGRQSAYTIGLVHEDSSSSG